MYIVTSLAPSAARGQSEALAFNAGFSWTQTAMLPLIWEPLLPDPLNPGKFLLASSAQALNNAGVIVGDSDVVPPGLGAVRVAARFNGSTVVVIAGSGHART